MTPTTTISNEWLVIRACLVCWKAWIRRDPTMLAPEELEHNEQYPTHKHLYEFRHQIKEESEK